MGRAREEVWTKDQCVCVCVITCCYYLWTNTENDSSGIDDKLYDSELHKQPVDSHVLNMD